MITVWSQTGSQVDCVIATGLMALDYGGWRNFPKGHHTVAERKALRSALVGVPRSTGTDFPTLDGAIRSRYGLPLRGVEGTLRQALGRTGTLLALGGRNGRLDRRDPWRRWDRDFVGSHAVAVIPRGGGRCLVLDPLAPMDFAGDDVSVEKVLTWANGPGPQHARTARLNEFGNAAGNAAEEDTVTEVTITLFKEGIRKCVVPAGGRAEGWSLDGLKAAHTFDRPSPFHADATVVIRQVPTKSPHGTFRRAIDGAFQGLYVPAAHATLEGPVTPPVDRVALKAELAETKAALAAAKAKIKELRSAGHVL
jgi:hypothetical protein